jgi:heptaprenyl diphosphate synthase
MTQLHGKKFPRFFWEVFFLQTVSRRLALCAVLTALALALSMADSLIPLALLIPVPGLRIGFANLVTVFALCRLSGRDALLILVARCLLSALGSGNLSALFFSLSGGLLALAAMALLLRQRRLSLLGVCIGGAAAHNAGQILAAIVYFSSPAPLLYLPPLLLCSLATGAVIGFASLLLVHRIPVAFTRTS